MAGKRVLITGAGKDRGLGQAFALAAGLNGAAKVGVHFHSSYVDAFDLVAELRKEGVDAFPVHADVTNLGDLWAMRSYVIEQMGGIAAEPADLQFGADGKRLCVRARVADDTGRAAGGAAGAGAAALYR